MDKIESKQKLLGERYQLLEPLGTGGMAVVYRAKDLRLERPVAIKILREDYSQSEAFRQQFKHEAMAAANLSHPNIVTVHDFGLDNGNLFLVMEYVPGTNLKSILKIRAPLPVDEALRLIIQACAGVGYAHRAGLIHCDIKPHNMLVTPDHRLKVTDFGIARALATISPTEQHDIVWGSPSYLSPEQSAGLAPSPSSDVYALGIVLYESLTGRLPFISNDPVELIQLHRNSNPQPPHQLNDNISPALEQIILKTLSKEPSSRYRTADQLGRVLETYISQPPKDANTSQISAPPRKPFPETRPTAESTPVQPVANSKHSDMPYPDSNTMDAHPQRIEWSTILLSLVTLLAVGGLIPFWLFIWFFISAAK